MKKLLRLASIFILALALVCCTTLVKDKKILREDLIRLHVVGHSDSREDQAVKLIVKAAVVDYLSSKLNGIQNAQQAKEQLLTLLPRVEAVANAALWNEGSTHTAAVTLALEEFDTRVYETFTLPAGVYQSLRISIGEAAGKNWWCVVFPSLCVPKTSQGFADKAVSAGMDKGLSDTLSGKQQYQFRFFLLDCVGKIENMFRKG